MSFFQFFFFRENAQGNKHGVCDGITHSLYKHQGAVHPSKIPTAFYTDWKSEELYCALCVLGHWSGGENQQANKTP